MVDSLLRRIDEATTIRNVAAATIAVLSRAAAEWITAAGPAPGSQVGTDPGRRIYENYPEIPTSTVAALPGLPENEVHRLLSRSREER